MARPAVTGARDRRGARAIAAVSRRLYRTLLFAYPRDFRAAHGGDAAEVFGEACAESWTAGGAVAVLRRLGRAVLDVPAAGISERIGHGPRPRLLGSLGGDVRHALRSCWRRPGLSFAIVVTLALGIGANTAIFSVVDATLLRPLPYPDAARVVYLQTRRDGAKSPGNPTADEFAQFAPRLQSYSRIEARSSPPRSVMLTAGGAAATRARLLGISGGFLAVLGARPVSGRLLLPDDTRPGAPPVVVLSDRFVARHYAPGAAVVGTTIDVDELRHVIVGVVPEIESDTPGLRYDLFAPLATSGPAARQTVVLAIGWLKPGVSIDAARAEFAAAGDVVLPSNVFWRAPALRDPQLAMMGAVFLLLLIACVNVANLLLANGQTRRSEMAVRVALGAGRVRLVRQLLVESVLLALAGCAIGVLIARAAIAMFTALEPGPQLLTRLESIEIDGVVLGYAVAIALMTSVVFGLVPALRGSATPPQAALREGDQRTGSRLRRWPGVFIAVEVALSIVLLIGAGLVGRAFVQMRFADPGFAADRVLTLRIALPEARYATADRRAQFFDALLARARRLPGVTAATIGYGATPPTDFVTKGALEIDNGGAEHAITWLS
ncbi:MAG TPA: ABC transporter permease, partial [Vicinamibacterales bacterium]|nr:ABC transporter permease [Vicinamibacterales bacterium]